MKNNSAYYYENGTIDCDGSEYQELPPEMDVQHFVKFFPKKFLPVLSKLEGKQVKVLTYILYMMRPSDNLFTATYSKIEKDVKISHQTVVKAMATLYSAEFIRPLMNGQWMVNPDMVCKGNDNKRFALHCQFYKLKKWVDKKNHPNT